MTKEAKSSHELNYTDQGIISYVSSDRQVQALNIKFHVRYGIESQVFKISHQVASTPAKEPAEPIEPAEKSPAKARKIRICLVGHCKPGSQYLSGDLGEQYSSKVVADHVVSCLKKVSQSHSLPSNSSIKISIIACNAGVGASGNPSGSFAESLFLELRSRGIVADVVARMRGVVIYRQGFRFWKEITCFESELKTEPHQPGSKVIFTSDGKGQTIFKDAYAVSWKTKVLSTIQRCIKETYLKNKKNN